MKYFVTALALFAVISSSSEKAQDRPYHAGPVKQDQLLYVDHLSPEVLHRRPVGQQVMTGTEFLGFACTADECYVLSR
jgi:hypothetical protein